VKRISGNELRSIDWVDLYLDDYDRLVELLGSAGRNLEITVNEYQLETPQEITQFHGTPVRKLRLSSRGNDERSFLKGVPLHMYGCRAHVHFENNGDFEHGLALQTIEFLRQRQSWAKRIKAWLLLALGFGAFIGLGIVPTETRKQIPPWMRRAIFGVTVAIALPSLWLAKNAFMDTEKGIALTTQRRSESKGFLQEHKGQLILMAIGATLGAILAFVSQALVRVIWPPK